MELPVSVCISTSHSSVPNCSRGPSSCRWSLPYGGRISYRGLGLRCRKAAHLEAQGKVRSTGGRTGGGTAHSGHPRPRTQPPTLPAPRSSHILQRGATHVLLSAGHSGRMYPRVQQRQCASHPMRPLCRLEPRHASLCRMKGLACHTHYHVSLHGHEHR